MKNRLPKLDYPVLMERYAKRLRESYFDTLPTYGPTDNIEPMIKALGLINEYEKRPLERKQIFSQIEVIMAKHPEINNHSILINGEKRGLACTALDKGLMNLAVYFINGIDKTTEEEVRNFYEQAARIEGSHVWDDYKKEESAINPKNTKQKAMLLMMYGTNGSEFGIGSDIASYLIEECNIDPHQEVSVVFRPQYANEDPVKISPFMYFLQKNEENSRRISIPTNLEFYATANPQTENLKGESLPMALCFTSYPSLAAEILTMWMPSKSTRKTADAPVDTRQQENIELKEKAEQLDLFGMPIEKPFREPIVSRHRRQKECASSAAIGHSR